MDWTDPKDRRAYRQKWKRANPEKVLRYARAWRRRHLMEIRAYGRTRYARVREQQLSRARLRDERIRQAVFAAYGAICCCCEETRKGFLTIDHQGDARRAPYRGSVEYRRLFRAGFPREGIRVMCMNCNWATRRGKPCPHKEIDEIGG